MKKIIIFGATGNLGMYLVDYFYEHLPINEYEIIAVGRKNTDFFTNTYGINYVQVDIADRKQFIKLPTENIHAVVNLAGAMPAQMEGYDPYEYINVNILGTLNILEFCRINKVDRILFTQTESDISGNWESHKVLKPDLPRKYSKKGYYALYITSKCTAVDLIEHYHLEFDLKRFIFRLPTIYLYKPNPYYYVNGKKKMLAYRYLINQAIEGMPIELWGDPTRDKDIVYVKDFCQMLYKAVLVNRDSGFYNVGTGVGVTLEEQITGIIEVFSPKNRKSEIIYCPDKPNSRSFIMDIENAKEELGYEPKYNYLDYLKDFKKEMELNRFKLLKA